MKKCMLLIFILSFMSLVITYAEEPDEEAVRLGTISRGELSIHLGDTPEQVHEVLGMPEKEKDKPVYMDSYPGLIVCYRNYTSLAEKYSWITAEGEDDYRVAMIRVLEPENAIDILNPYTTAEGIGVYAFASAMENISTLYSAVPPNEDIVNYYSQIYYDGEYYTYEGWEEKKQELRGSGNSDDYSRALMEVVRVYYMLDKKRNQVNEIDVADEMFAMWMK